MLNDAAPAVTVAIPTRNRPDLLRRALDSVLAQTYHPFEILVVIDGPDSNTEAIVRREPDQRLRHHVNPQRLGGAGARNVAVSMARGHWIAFLDDDDVWLPGKLERQLRRLDPADENVVSFTRLVAAAPHGAYVWPRRGPRPGEHISEYLFVRRSPFAGEGGIQTSTIIAPRTLLLAHPMDETLERLQDTDWQLRVGAAGARFDFCPEPLTVWHIEEGRDSITESRRRDWRLLVAWISARRPLVTPRAYASFLLVRGGSAAAAAGDITGGWLVWREAYRRGKPSAIDVGLFVTRWLVPPRLRRWVRSRFSPWRVRGFRAQRPPARQWWVRPR